MTRRRAAKRSTGETVPCPDCGERFAPRGLASHRRHRHPTPPDPMDAVAARLGELAEALTGLDARLDRVEAWLAAGPAPAAGAPRARKPREEVDALREELDEVLAAVRLERAGASDEADDATRRTLGALRRRQLALLHRLGPDAPGALLGEDGQPLGLY